MGARTFYFGYDSLGSTRMLFDDSASVTDTYDYTAFGEIHGQTGLTDSAYQFTGEQYDNTLGQYYLRARYYNQTIGRFAQLDTYQGQMAYPASLHKYLYTANEPINMIDPTEHMSLGSQGASSSIMGVLSSMATSVTRLAATGFARVGMSSLSVRISSWYIINESRIQLYSLLSVGAAEFLHTATGMMLNNMDPVMLEKDGNQGNHGKWLEQKIGTNRDLEVIDDFRDGNATSVKTSSQNMDRLLKRVRIEANTLKIGIVLLQLPLALMQALF